LYWNITTDAPGSTQASTDWAAYNSGGTGFTINSNTGSFSIDALADTTTETAETYYLQVRTGSDTGSIQDSIQLDITDDSQSAPPANAPTVTPSTTTPTEGNTVTFTFGEAAGSAAQTYYFDITHGTTSNADFTAVPPGNDATARTTVTWNGTSFSPTSVAVTLAGAGGADGVDDNETFTGKLFDAVTGGTEVATTANITVADDPTALTFAFDPTLVRHRRFTNNPFSGCTTTSQIDFLRNGSTAIQSTGFGTENVETITPALDTGNNWSSTQNSTFGDSYQILFQVYENSGLTILTSSTRGSVAGDAYEVLKGGVATSWTQSTANTWIQLSDIVRLQATRAEGGTGDGSGAGSSAITNYVKYTIKQYSGVLGTGTTVLTGNFEHKVEASDGPS
jgi:hypothetical protein